MGSTEKTDLKDRRILHELDVNSRQSYSQISRKVKLPKTVVIYRIDSLTKKGILKNTYALVNFTRLGFMQFKVYLKLQSAGRQKEQEIIKYLVGKKKIIWATSCRGSWDISITAIARDVVEFDRLLKEIINAYGKYISDKDILIVSYSPLFSKKYLLPEKEKQEFLYMEEIKQEKIDEVDEKVLKILANNSRASVLEMMENLKLTRDVISYRIKKLEKSGVILAYRSLIDLEKIGYRLYKIILKIQNFSEKEESELISYCKANKNLVQYIRLVGNWDVEIEAETESEDEAYRIVNEIRDRFSNLIKDYSILRITEEHKLNFYPL